MTHRYVLTAAHCMILKPPKVMSRAVAVLGEHDRSNPYDKAVEINVGRVINHPNYNFPDFGKKIYTYATLQFFRFSLAAAF